MNEQFIWFLVGLVPYYAPYRRQADGKWMLEIWALFWFMHISWGSSGIDKLTFRIQLIERLKDAIWAAVLRLRDIQPSQGNERS